MIVSSCFLLLLNHVVITGLAVLHEVGDGDAVEVFVDDFVEALPERESFAASHSGAVGAAGFEAGYWGHGVFGEAKDAAYCVLFRCFREAVAAAFAADAF